MVISHRRRIDLNMFQSIGVVRLVGKLTNSVVFATVADTSVLVAIRVAVRSVLATTGRVVFCGCQGSGIWTAGSCLGSRGLNCRAMESRAPLSTKLIPARSFPGNPCSPRGRESLWWWIPFPRGSLC